MSMEMMKKVAIGTVGVASLTIGSMASAQIYPSAGTYVFNAPGIELTKSVFGIPVTLTCDTALVGNVSQNGSGDIVIKVTDGSVYGGTSSQCTGVDLQFDDFWYASPNATPPTAPGSVPLSSFPSTSDTTSPDVDGYFHNVKVSTPIGDCGGTIPVTYNNEETFAGSSNPSTFTINGTLAGVLGSCTIDGTFSAASSAGGFTGDAPDVDVYQ